MEAGVLPMRNGRQKGFHAQKPLSRPSWFHCWSILTGSGGAHLPHSPYFDREERRNFVEKQPFTQPPAADRVVCTFVPL